MKKWFFIGAIAFILWFIPWVFAFYCGMVIYFPYKADGSSRYVRATGPLLAVVGLDKAWVPDTDIPLVCKAALIGAEDARFLDHYGIDTKSIKEALERNAKRGKIKSGASTVTQQLVKNVFLHREKSYVRKSREIVGAVILDVIMSKETQLAWYLNVVEFGPEIYGLRNAATYYFSKDPKRLNLSECASLVALLRDPVKSSKWLKAKTLPVYLSARRDKVVSNVLNWGIVHEIKAAR